MDEVKLKFLRREVTRRPEITVSVMRITREVWPMFKPFHYMSAELVKQAKCFGTFVDDQIVSFVAVIHFPHPNKDACGYRCHRLVTLPDWQGIGLGLLLLDTVASAYKGLGEHFSMPAAHPSLIRSLDKSRNWILTKPPGKFSALNRRRQGGVARMGGRACAVFRFCGAAMNQGDAMRLIA